MSSDPQLPSTGHTAGTTADPDRETIVADESALLARTHQALEAATRRVVQSYDQELIALRDQIAEARLEDVPPLVQQMERMQRIAANRALVPTGTVDAGSPYFGHLRLEENGRKRDVLIGNTTYVDTERGVRIVDWRDAPVSRLYYRYAEGDEYEEEFGGRALEGTVRARRSVVISDGELRRVLAPQGTYVRRVENGQVGWRSLDAASSKLAGGQGVAERPPSLEEYSVRRGRLGVRVDGREDRHLPDIPALIDKRQFELISKPHSGLVVIQGGAGSGKTTIGLHRMAYLAYNDPRRFTPDRMMVVVFNDALAAYIARVLPGLGVQGVQVVTYATWAERQRMRHLPRTPREYTDETPPLVTRLKKHPAMLRLIDERVAREAESIGTSVERALEHIPGSERAIDAWRTLAKLPPALRVAAAGQWLRGEREAGAVAAKELTGGVRAAMGAALDRVRPRAREVLWDWAELVTDAKALREGFERLAPGLFSDAEIALVVRYCADRVGPVTEAHRGEAESESEPKEARDEARGGDEPDDRDGARAKRRGNHAADREEALSELEARERPASSREARSDDDDDDEDRDERDDNPYRVLDGVDEHTRTLPSLDREDDALLLRLYQKKCGPLRRDRKMALLYEHVFVDEAQDLSPVELAVLLDCVTPARSVTLAGDTAQRLQMDNGFTDWQGVLDDLGLSSVSVEPLRIGYRSTREVLDFARAVLGPLADPEPPVATRSGAPVEMHRQTDTGAAVAFLGHALRELALNEPRASVAVITREPDRADLWFQGLERAEVPRLSRVRAQDFSFKAGVEVTDIRQVKGLEFDYVVLVDVTAGFYPVTSEARHLLHIGATRAAHQLWLVATGEPSKLLPDDMRD